MAEETAPASSMQQNKRVRFDVNQPATPKQPKDKKESPKSLALSSILRFSETLQSDLGTIFNNLGKEWIDIIAKYRTKTDQIIKMKEDDDFIPRSARINEFNFYVTKAVEEDADFTVIKEDTAAITLRYRKDLKTQVLRTMIIEIKILEARARKHFLHAVTTVTKATLIATQVNAACLHRIINTIFEFNDERILDETGIAYEDFCEAYKTEHALTVFPITDTPAVEVSPETHNQERIKDAAPSKINILATLITPVEIFIAREKAIETNITLRKLLTSTEQEKSNEETQIRMDLEGSVDKELIQEMINKATEEKTKALRSELGQLKKLIKNTDQGKKDRRGQLGGASTPSKKSTKRNHREKGKKSATSDRSPSPSAPNARRKPRGQKADGRDNATSTKKSKKKQQTGRKKK